MATDLQFIKPGITIIFLVILLIIEFTLPYYIGRKNKIRHDLKNVILGILNAFIVTALFTGILLFAGSRSIGLLKSLTIPLAVTLILAVLLFDLWMYLWHRINHKIPFLWRFHRVHHTDRQVDASSALRFHTGEIILSTLARVVIIILLGLQLWHVVLYEAILLPIILFHHSNVRISDTFDKIYRTLFVSPRMHWIHHSDVQKETDSNYGSIFSFWDRMFKSYTKKETKDLTQGLKEFEGKEWNQFSGMLKTPFIKR